MFRYPPVAFALVLVIARCFVSASAEPSATPEWQVLEPPGEGFRIELPGKPESQSGELDAPAGKVYMRLYQLKDEKRRRVYNLAATRLPIAPNEAGVAAALDRARDGAVKSIKGKLLDEQRIKLERFHGRALTVETPTANMFAHARLYVADERLYQVIVIADSKTLSDEDQRVLASFQIREAKLVDPEPKIDWRFITPRGEKTAVEMPGDAHESTGALDTPLGRVTLTRLECRKGNGMFFLQFSDFPASLTGDDAARLDAAREHALRATGGKLIEETPLSVSERTGRAAVIAAGERTLRLRTLVDGLRVYQLGSIAVGRPTAAQSEDDRRFFESLKLPPREAK